MVWHYAEIVELNKWMKFRYFQPIIMGNLAYIRVIDKSVALVFGLNNLAQIMNTMSSTNSHKI